MGARKKISAEKRKEALKTMYFAKLQNVPTSPRKMRLVADMIRGMEVNRALGVLKFSSKEASARVEKLLRSAIANWEQKNERKAEDGELFVTKIYVDGGATLKRMRPAPQGRGYRIRKRSNHVTLFVDSKNTNDKKSILIVGIGRSQEPFSYLASIKELIKDKKLKDVLNLQTVDLQAKPTKNILLSCTHYGGFWGKEPIFAKSSFIKYAQMYGDTVLQTGFRVNDEIFDYLYKTYNNKSKSKWATRIQDDIKNYPDNSFDVLSMNNVLGYIEDDDEYYSTIKNMPRIVKPNGFIITDTICENLFQKVGVDKMLTKISAGIFKKSNN